MLSPKNSLKLALLAFTACHTPTAHTMLSGNPFGEPAHIYIPHFVGQNPAVVVYRPFNPAQYGPTIWAPVPTQTIQHAHNCPRRFANLATIQPHQASSKITDATTQTPEPEPIAIQVVHLRQEFAANKELAVNQNDKQANDKAWSALVRLTDISIAQEAAESSPAHAHMLSLIPTEDMSPEAQKEAWDKLHTAAVEFKRNQDPLSQKDTTPSRPTSPAPAEKPNDTKTELDDEFIPLDIVLRQAQDARD